MDTTLKFSDSEQNKISEQSLTCRAEDGWNREHEIRQHILRIRFQIYFKCGKRFVDTRTILILYQRKTTAVTI